MIKNLYLDVVNVFISDYNLLDRELIKRIEIKNENDMYIQIDNYLSQFEEVTQVDEKEKPNGYKYFYKVKQFNGLNAYIAFNLTNVES